MANGNGQLGINPFMEHPQNTNVFGIENQDSKFISEFTFHHGRVRTVINTAKDLEDSGHYVSNIPTNLSQCVFISPTFAGNITVSDKELVKPPFARPLLRGISDSMSYGDSVIYTQIPHGGENPYFYLGPLNTTNNPNYCPDHLYNPDLNPSGFVLDKGENSDGGNLNYIKKGITKVSKPRNPDLDRPFDLGVGENGSTAEINSHFSDLQLEGRFGNTIRLGARSFNPYTIISNNNGAGSDNFNNGSIIGMLSLGSISQNFLDFTQLSVDKVVAEANEKGESGYLGFPIGHGNDSKGTPPENIFNNDFGAVQESPELQTEFDQIIMFSDRITFDARENDLTVSAFRNINFGAGKNFTLTNKGFTVLESKNIYIGKSAKQRSQPMVLGEELRRLLVSILRLINDSRALVQGVPIPLMKQDSSPLLADITKIMQEFNLGMMPSPGGTPESPDPGYNIQVEEEKPLGDRTTGGATFFSNHHFIETNRS